MEQNMEMSEHLCTRDYLLSTTSKGKRFIYLVDAKKVFELDEETYNLLKKNSDNISSFPDELKKYLESPSDYEYIEFGENDNFRYKKTLSKLVLVLTNRCNLDCLYCYADGGSYGLNQEHMSINTIERLFEYFSDNKISIGNLMLFGREPLLAMEQIENVFMLSKKYEVTVKQYLMVSNFTVLTDDQIKFLIDNTIRITVSLDGPKSINDQLRVFKFKKESSSFDEVKKNIKRFMNAGGTIDSIESTYTKKHEQMNISKNDVIDFIKDGFGIENVMIYDVIDENKSDGVSFDRLRVENYFLDPDRLYSDDLKCLNSLFGEKQYNHQIQARLSYMNGGAICHCES